MLLKCFITSQAEYEIHSTTTAVQITLHTRDSIICYMMVNGGWQRVNEGISDINKDVLVTFINPVGPGWLLEKEKDWALELPMNNVLKKLSALELQQLLEGHIYYYKKLSEEEEKYQNCMNTNPRQNYKPDYSHIVHPYFCIMTDLEDNEKSDIGRYFDEVVDLIHEEHLAGGNTLVYCVAGISRSATFCIAYLMKHNNLNLRNAFRHLRSRRRIVRPNNGFFRQLIEYEKRLYNETSVQMVRVPNADTPDCMVPDVFYEVCKGIVWLKSCKNSLRR
ncbi:Dual specificity protein phosphatase 14 [Araneus ventricosus]|uniref:Dual specificity protein phosphatase 14 n=1 Tax=Araneus ventricosus TaxID=182803 RepID=A0A4Y2SZJ8_ARAVE|nr:Dual specificity protein phosphatase 14 [Araneus ventricosus]